MRNTRIYCSLLLLLFTLQSNAQSYSIDGIKYVSSHGIKPIMNGKEIGGYIIFYKKDKADAKNDNYGFYLTSPSVSDQCIGAAY